MPRILYLIDNLSFGGAERQLSLLLRHLSPGWETRVVALGGGPYHQVLLDQTTSIAVYQRRSRFDLIPVFRLYWEILRHKPDIIHSWGGLCSAIVAPICKITPIALIDGSIRIGGASSRHYWRTRLALSLADHVVANSYAGLSAYPIPAKKGSVIYNGFDLDRLDLAEQKVKMEEDVTTVIMTARISPFKDFASFFEAARRLGAQEPGCWRFVAIGAGDKKDRASLMKLAEDLVSGGIVELPQAGLEVLPFLRGANVGVLLSASCFKEGFANSIMEYMACELPVICSDSGGNRELVVDGETGFVIPSESVDSLVEKLSFLKTHPDIAYEMGRAGYERVLSLCSIRRMTSDYEVVYTWLLGKGHEKMRGEVQAKKMDGGGLLNGRRQTPGEESQMPRGLAPGQRDPLRVAVIVEDLRQPFDEGAKNTGFSLIRSFMKKGARVSVFTRYENPFLKDAFPLPGNKLLLGYSFGRTLRAQSPHVILYMPASSGTVGAFVRAAVLKTQSFGIPLALLSLQYRELPASARYLGLHRCADIVFTQSQASTEVFRSLGCKTTLLPGGVDLTVFRPVSKEEKRLLRLEYGLPNADQIVLHVGHCNRNRNVTTLARLVGLGFSVILVASTSTAIDGDLLVELRQSGVTVITDFIEKVQHFYQMADCYLFPVFRATSAIDAPLSVLEAMACNLPVVTTRFGALPGMFQPGNGFYYGDTDEEIVRTVKRAAEEQHPRTFEMVAPYSWDNAAATILETLQEPGNL